MRTNYLGGIWCLRAFLPALEAAAPSDVVNIVSVAGVGRRSRRRARTPRRSTPSSRSRARRRRSCAPRGIRVHTVKPGFVETEGFPQKLAAARRAAVRRSGRSGSPRTSSASIEHGRGETTVPRYYAVGGVAAGAGAELVRARLPVGEPG